MRYRVVAPGGAMRRAISVRGHLDIGSGEIVALEQERLAPCPGERIGDAVSEIEASGMALAFPELSERLPRQPTCSSVNGAINNPRFETRVSSSAAPFTPPRASATIAASRRLALAMNRESEAKIQSVMRVASASLLRIARSAEESTIT